MIRINLDEDCPSEDFSEGQPSGTCWGDGHYKCDDCMLFRADFKSDPTKRDRLLAGQGFIKIYTLNNDLTFEQVI